MKTRLVPIAKIVIPVAILSWLLHKEWDAIQALVTRPKNMTLLAVSLGCLLVATCLSIFRWFLLVRALDIPFAIRDAFRLGFLGYLFNFVGPGAVGGDLFKAWFLAKDQKERRSEAVATILLDRVVGMFSLFTVATIAILYARGTLPEELGTLLNVIPVLTVCGITGIALLIMPGRFTDWLLDPIERLPLIGNFVARVRAALELYRAKRSWLAAIGLLGLTVHSLVAVSMHFSDRAVHQVTPTFSEHAIICPLANAASAAPVPGGLGTYEFTVDYLFSNVPDRKYVADEELEETSVNGVARIEKGQGMAVAVLYRLMNILIACIGVGYYLLNRKEVSEATASIEAEQNEDTSVASSASGDSSSAEVSSEKQFQKL